MKCFFYKSKTLKGINGHLRRIGLDEFQLEDFPKHETSIDFDWWMDHDKKHGASVVFYQTNNGFEAFATKYTQEDLQNDF